jgi:hypothetical protein
MTLDQLKHTRRKLQGVQAAAAQAVQREQKNVDKEQFEVSECGREVEAARDRITLDTAEAALDSALKDHTLALKRLADRQAEHTYAELQVHTAQAQVVEAVDQILADELAQRAKRVNYLLNEALSLGTELKYFAIAAGVNSTKIISPSTLSVVDRLSQPLIDGLTTPIHLANIGDVAAFRAWTERRDQMIAADGETVAETA